MENLPVYISLIFISICFITVLFFFKAGNNSKIKLLIISNWIAFQSIIALSGFYENTSAIPPRFLVMVLPPMLLIIGLFAHKEGRKYLDSLNIEILTIIHVIRIPIEIVLYFLFLHKAIPELMTFEGRNFDIISGLSALIIYYLGFVKNRLNKKIILIWNFICLALLFNIVVNAVLSAPYFFQQFSFAQPNRAILYFPYNLLPSFIVPVILFSHLVAIRRLSTKPNKV